MKKLFKDKENRNFILILLGIAIVVALIGWIKSGGDLEIAAAIFVYFFIILIIGALGFVGATFVRNYLDEKQSKIKIIKNFNLNKLYVSKIKMVKIRIEACKILCLMQRSHGTSKK